MKNLLQKTSVTLFVILSAKFNLMAKEFEVKKQNKVYSSTDVTILGIQGRLAYDFYTAKGHCFGVSISQLGGLKRVQDDNTIFYNLQDIRLNLSARYTKKLFENNRISSFGIFQAGISYNTILTGEQLILPSFRMGCGLDITIFKESGVRLEAGIGSPYFVSIGYFFTI